MNNPLADGKIVHCVRDKYGLIQVIDTPTQRSLYFDTPVEQSRLYFNAPMTLAFEYQQIIIDLITEHMTITPVNHSLTLGLGGGMLSNHLHCLLPNSLHQVVELRKRVINIAKRFFFLVEHPLVQTIEANALHFVKEAEPVDLIIVDLYDGEAMPNIFSEESFLEKLLTLKKPNGLILLNLWTSTPATTLRILSYWQRQKDLQIRTEKTQSSGNLIVSIQ